MPGTTKGIDCKKEMGKIKGRITRLFGQGKISRFDFDEAHNKLEALDVVLKGAVVVNDNECDKIESAE